MSTKNWAAAPQVGHFASVSRPCPPLLVKAFNNPLPLTPPGDLVAVSSDRIIFLLSCGNDPVTCDEPHKSFPNCCLCHYSAKGSSVSVAPAFALACGATHTDPNNVMNMCDMDKLPAQFKASFVGMLNDTNPNIIFRHMNCLVSASFILLSEENTILYEEN